MASRRRSPFIFPSMPQINQVPWDTQVTLQQLHVLCTRVHEQSKADHWDTIWTSVVRRPWRLRLCPIAMIISLAWFGCDDAHKWVVLTAMMSHEGSSLIATKIARTIDQFTHVDTHGLARLLAMMLVDEKVWLRRKLRDMEPLWTTSR